MLISFDILHRVYPHVIADAYILANALLIVTQPRIFQVIQFRFTSSHSAE
jgi:hypothetical protein